MDKKALMLLLAEDFSDRHEAALKQGRNYTVSEYARWFGIPEPTMSKIMKGHIPSDPNLHKLAARLGPGVYRAAGKPERLPDNPRLRFIAERFHLLPEGAQEKFVRLVERELEQGGEGEPRPGDNQQEFAL
jgi:hypothetical protein